MKPKNVLQIFQEQNGVNKVLSSELFFIFLQGILLSLGISIFEGHISESTILIVMCSTLQFSLVAHLCPILCSLMDCSTPGFPVHHQLPELAQIHVHQVHDAIQPSVVPFSSRRQSFPAAGSFPMSQFFASGGQSIGALALASVY